MNIRINKTNVISGEISVPGDKSISHRALLFGGIASGNTLIHGILQGQDCLSTLSCLRMLGVKTENEEGVLKVSGRGGDFSEPDDVLDCGNSGTTMRLLAGILAARPFYSVVTGDGSLRKRPMGRVIEPLTLMGGELYGRAGGHYPPVSIIGKNLRCMEYMLPVASAQVKSAIMLASLFAEGTAVITEPFRSRDHTERMLRCFGGSVVQDDNTIAVKGRQELHGREIFIPGDFSSAAYFMAAASMLDNAVIRIENVGLNPTRTGFLDVMKRMGADVKVDLDEKDISGEPRGCLEVRGRGGLKGIEIIPDEIPGIIDEIPLVAVLACFAEGETVISGAGELRVKESDRLKTITEGLNRMGAGVVETEEGLLIRGRRNLNGAVVDSGGDHRIAMALAVAGLAARSSTIVRGFECVRISFPDFLPLMKRTGAVADENV